MPSATKSKIGGASKKGRQHVAHQRKCLRQWERTAKNKLKAWRKHLDKHPNDARAKENIGRAKDNLKTLGKGATK